MVVEKRTRRQTTAQAKMHEEDAFSDRWREIPELGPGQAYKYLGVLQDKTTTDRVGKKQFRESFMHRVRQTVKTALSTRDKLRVLECWALPKLRYTAPLALHTQQELRDIDMEVRRILRAKKVIGKHADIDTLYYPRGLGGRGVPCVETTIQEDIIGFAEYVEALDGREILKQIDVPEYSLEGSPLSVLNQCAVEAMDSVGERFVGEGNKHKFRGEKIQKRRTTIEEKVLHGKFFRQLAEPGVDERLSASWHNDAHMPNAFERAMFEIREEAMPTRSNLKKWKLCPNGNCRFCGRVSETAQHLAVGCVETHGLTLYKNRHDMVAKALYSDILRKFGEDSGPWWKTKPKTAMVLGSGGESVLFWDKKWTVGGGDLERSVEHCRPDMVVLVTPEEILIIEVSVPADSNVVESEQAKYSKYIPLMNQLVAVHSKPTKIVPIVVGNTGLVSVNIQRYLQQIGISTPIQKLQKTAAMESVKILFNLLGRATPRQR